MLTFIEPYISPIVQTLAHSLWQGMLVVVLLWGVLRSIPARRAEIRYGFSLGALVLLIVSALVTFSVLQPGDNGVTSVSHSTTSVQTDRQEVMHPSEVVGSRSGNVGSPSANRVVPAVSHSWGRLSWPYLRVLFWGWLIGAGVMVVRVLRGLHAGYSLAAGARPLAAEMNPQAGELLRLVAELRERLGLRFAISVRISERIDIPAVWGWFAPVLLIPAAMLTGLTVDQWRVIIAHELAHVRRFDALIDFSQRLIEAVLFFNPAVWWLNRRIRAEREACCDHVAAELMGESDAVALTLVSLADRIQAARSAAVAVSAFADESQPGELTERVNRLVTPDARPRLLLPWASLLGLLVLFAVALLLAERTSTYAVQVVRKIMTPAERAERIVEIEKEFPAEDYEAAAKANEEQLSQKISVEGTVRLIDGKEFPANFRANYFGTISRGSQSGSTHGSLNVPRESTTVFRVSQTLARFDELLFWFEIPGYAVAIAGPYKAPTDEEPVKFDLVMDRGFEGVVALRGPEGEPVTDARVRASLFFEKKRFSNSGSSSSKAYLKNWDLEPDATGKVRIPNAVAREMEWTIVAPGYQETVVRQSLKADQAGEIRLARARPTTGVLLDAVSRQPIPNADVILCAFKNQKGSHSFQDPRDRNSVVEPWRVFAKSDAEGRFVLDMLRDSVSYSFFVRAEGGRCAALRDVRAGEEKAREILMPEPITVSGRVVGDLAGLPKRTMDKEWRSVVSWSNPLNEEGRYTQEAMIYSDKVGGTFTIQNLVPGKLELRFGEKKFEFDIKESMTGLAIDLTPSTANESLNGVTVDVSSATTMAAIVRVRITGLPAEIPSKFAAYYYHGGNTVMQKVELTSPDFEVSVPVGKYLNLKRIELPGYWANGIDQKIEIKKGGLVIDWPVYPAGGITGKFVTIDPEDPPPQFFLYTIVRPPSVKGLIDLPEPRFGDNGEFVFAPLPLGGKYRLVAQDRGLGSAGIAIREIDVTSEQPFPEVEIRFPAGRTIQFKAVDQNGNPLPNQNVTLAYGNSFSLFDSGNSKPTHRTTSEKTFSAQTDSQGIAEFQHVRDDIPNQWSLVANPTERLLGERLKIDPQINAYTAHYRPGVVVAGQLLDSTTSRPVVDKTIYCSPIPPEGKDASRVVGQSVIRTDSEGRFHLLLDQIPYSLRVFGFQIESVESAEGPVILEREQVPLRNPPLPEPRRPLPSVKLPFPIRSPLTIKVTPDS